MRLLVLVIALLPLASAGGETLWFVGDGSSNGGGIIYNSNFEVSSAGHGNKASSWTTVAGNSLGNNGYLPTFVWDEDVIGFSGEPFQVYHYADVRAGAVAAAGCGLIGTMYDSANAILKAHTVTASGGGSGPVEFIFTFEGIVGEHAQVDFQPVQSANQCGWLTIVHEWGADDVPGRIVLGPNDYLGAMPEAPPVPLGSTTYEDVDGEFLTFDGNYETPHTGTYIYNWTTPAHNVTYDFDIGWVAGGVSIAVKDGIGVSLYDEAFTDAAAPNGTFQGANGTWQVTLDFDAYEGSFGLDLTGLIPAGTPGAGGPTGGNGTTGGTGGTGGNDGTGGEGTQSTGNGTADGKESPGLALPVFALALGLVAAIRRRK